MWMFKVSGARIPADGIVDQIGISMENVGKMNGGHENSTKLMNKVFRKLLTGQCDLH
jgi:hypothetical protein